MIMVQVVIAEDYLMVITLMLLEQISRKNGGKMVKQLVDLGKLDKEKLGDK